MSLPTSVKSQFISVQLSWTELALFSSYTAAAHPTGQVQICFNNWHILMLSSQEDSFTGRYYHWNSTTDNLFAPIANLVLSLAQLSPNFLVYKQL